MKLGSRKWVSVSVDTLRSLGTLTYGEEEERYRMINAPVEDVSDTARWVAHFRAIESERPDALFQDPYARRLAGERGKRIAELLPKGPLSWSVAVRTKVFDELILDAVRTRSVHTVLNLAAGLDTRAYRLPLPPSLRWVEVDLPALLEWKGRILEREVAACRVERVSLDLARREQRKRFFAELGTNGPGVLAVTEGLLSYLPEHVVASLAVDLAEAFPGALWVLENLTPAVLERLKRSWDASLKPAGVEMTFAPKNGLEFFREFGWRTVLERPLLDEAQRFGRETRLVSTMRAVSQFIPLLGAAYARRHAKFREAVVYALLEHQGRSEIVPPAP